MVLASGVDWTKVLDTAIITLPAIIAAWYAARIHSQIKTPSRRSIGKQVEWTGQTAKANNMLLANANGETKPAEPGQLTQTGAEGPSVPVES